MLTHSCACIHALTIYCSCVILYHILQVEEEDAESNRFSIDHVVRVYTISQLLLLMLLQSAAATTVEYCYYFRTASLQRWPRTSLLVAYLICTYLVIALLRSMLLRDARDFFCSAAALPVNTVVTLRCLMIAACVHRCYRCQGAR